jgi:hypothetical protein
MYCPATNPYFAGALTEITSLHHAPRFRSLRAYR